MRHFFWWVYRFCLWVTLFFCVVLLVLSCTVIADVYQNLQKTGAITVTLFLSLGLVLFFFWSYGKMPDRGWRVSAVLFLSILGLQVFFLVMVSCPMSISDPARVQNEALAMLKWNHGQINEKNLYFQNYPNNHFIVIFFYYFYKILSSVGITKVWIPTIILNIFCMDAGILFTYAAAKKIKGVVVANMTLLFFLVCPTTYLWLTSVYTNTLSFPFIMAILYWGIDIEKGRSSGKVWRRTLLLGVGAVLGCFVRPTTIIAVIALMLYSSVRFFQERGEEEIKKEKRGDKDTIRWSKMCEPLLRYFVLFLVCGATWFAGNKLIDRHVDADKFTEQFPVVHWIMMGMNEETGGGYSREDRLYTEHLSGLEKKKEGDRERLKQRLQHMGVSGVGKQFVQKLTRVWAMGDDDGLANAKYAYHYPPLYQYIIEKHNTWFVFYMQAFRIVMFLLMGFALAGELMERQCMPLFLYGLTFLGAVCFFLIWEAGKRYNICFNGICLLLMVAGINYMKGWLHKGEIYIVDRKKKTSDSRLPALERKMGSRVAKDNILYKLVRTGCFCGMIGILAGGFLLVAQYGEAPKMDKFMYYCSKMGTDAESIDRKGISRADLLEQTIGQGQMEWRNCWNRLKIYFVNSDPREKKAEYRVEVISQENNQVIYSRDIAPQDVKKKGAFVIRLHHNKRNRMSQVGYKLRLTHIGKNYHLLPMVCKFPLLAPYPYGSLSVNGRERDWDLSMAIYDVR